MIRALGVAVGLSLLVAADAAAKVGVQFDRLYARPGEAVRLAQPTSTHFLERGTSVRVYLITARDAQELVWPGGRGLVGMREGAPPLRLRKHYLGTLTPGRTSVTFRVPRVAPGRYTWLAWTSWSVYFPGFSTAYGDRYYREPPREVLRVRR